MDQEPGLYRAVFRMKAADRTSPRRLAFLRVTGDGLVSTGLTAGRTINGTDFAEPNQYQEFAVEFIRSPFGGLQSPSMVRGHGPVARRRDDSPGAAAVGPRSGRALSPQRRLGCNADDRSKAYVCQGLIAGLWRLKMRWPTRKPR